MPRMKDSTSTPRAWQRMLSGRRLDLLDPSPLDIEIEDIAHGLARVARWNGQTKGAHAFSVAQHCVLVERFVHELKPKAARPLRLGGAAARRRRICDRRPDQPVQGGGRPRLQGVREPPCPRHPHPLRAAAGKHAGRGRAHQAGRPHLGLFRSKPIGRLHRHRGPKILRHAFAGSRRRGWFRFQRRKPKRSISSASAGSSRPRC